MEEYRILSNIKFKGKKFLVLSNKNYEKYFLRVIEEDKLEYPELDEFAELYKIYNTYDINKVYCINLPIIMNKENKKSGKIKIEPKVWVKGALVSLAMAIALSGCAQDRVIASSSQSNSELENTSSSITVQIPSEEESSSPETTDLESNQNSQTKEEQEDPIIQDLNSYGINTEKLTDNVYIIKEFFSDVYCTDVKDFKKYVDLKNPTYEDVKNIVINNQDIPEQYQEWLVEELNNLQEAMPDLDLTVLAYNMQRAKITYKTDEEIQAVASENTMAYFVRQTGEIVVNPETATKWIIAHEVLGHGLTEAEVDYNGNKIQKLTKMPTVIVKDDGTYTIELFGNSMEEAKAEKIAEIASKGSLGENLAYVSEEEQIRIFLEAIDMSLEEFIAKGNYGLYNKMKEVGIENPLEYIECADVNLQSKEQDFTLDGIDDVDKDIKGNIRRFFTEMAEIWKQQGESVDDICLRVEEITKNPNINFLWRNRQTDAIVNMQEITEETVACIQEDERN